MIHGKILKEDILMEAGINKEVVSHWRNSGGFYDGKLI